jgi:hypothetical protein
MQDWFADKYGPVTEDHTKEFLVQLGELVGIQQDDLGNWVYDNMQPGGQHFTKEQVIRIYKTLTRAHGAWSSLASLLEAAEHRINQLMHK